MFVYLIRRIILLIPTLMGILVFNFLVASIAPGSPVDNEVSKIRFAQKSTSVIISPETIEALKEQFGLNESLAVRFWHWLGRVSTFDFGESFVYRDKVQTVITEALPISLGLGIISVLVLHIIAIPLAFHIALKESYVFSKLATIALFFSNNMPPLIMGIFLLNIFAFKLQLVPYGGLQPDSHESMSFFELSLSWLHHLVLPISCYVLAGLAPLVMLMKNSIIDVSKMDFIKAVRAKGIPEGKIAWKHIFRLASLPLVVDFGSYFSSLFMGALLIENIFDIPGIGKVAMNAVTARDYNLLMGIVFMSSLTLMLGRLAGDILYRTIDPRVDYN